MKKRFTWGRARPGSGRKPSGNAGVVHRTEERLARLEALAGFGIQRGEGVQR